MSKFITKFVTGLSTVAMATSMLIMPATTHAATAGEVYKTTDGTVWFITSDMQKRAFTSWGAFESYGFLSAGQIQTATDAVIALPSGALVAPQDGRIFCATATKDSDVKGECSLITGGKKAAFTSAAVFGAQGFSFANAYNGDSSFLTKTSNIDNGSAAHSAGVLVNNGGTIQLVVSGGLWGTPSMDVFNSWGWKMSDVVTANAADKMLSQTGVIVARTAGQLSPSASTTPTGNTADCSNLDGTTGSITVNDLSDYNNEEVGEGESEVPIMAFEVEADNDSDVAVTSIKVEFNENGAGSMDLEDYASEVTIMLDGDVVGSADVNDFTETSTNGTWTKTISLDCAAISADSTGEFTIAVDGNNVIDSNDQDEPWIVNALNVRFEDGDGVVSTEDVSGDGLEKTFTWTSFASASDIELKASLTDSADAINDAHVIDIDDTNDTKDEEILAFTLENKGDVDITVNDIPVVITTTGETDESVLLLKATLWQDGDEIASDSVVAGGAVLFENLDLAIDAGDSVDFTVAVDIQDTAGAADNGDTVQATLTVGSIDADDSEGDALAGGDLTGTAIGGTHGVYDAGMRAEYVSSTAVATPSGVATVDDTGTFKIVFDVTAFDTDIFIDASPIADETGIIAAGAAGYQNIDANTTSVAAGVIECVTCEATANTTLRVVQGTTETFTVTIAGSGADVFAFASLTSIMYSTTAIDGATLYTFNMGDFKTNSVWLDSN